MRKLGFSLVFFVFCGLLVFGNPDEQAEELDHLLFLPNSSNQFVNQEQANIQLDEAAAYLLGRNLAAGQIFVYGYSAFAAGGVDPIDLSRERALFVISELQRRGVPADLFSPPVARGTVYLWGGNIDEASRMPNRRVRIVLDGHYLRPGMITAAEPVVEIAAIDETIGENDEEESASRFSWVWLLPLLLLLLLLLFLLKNKKSKMAVVPIIAASEEIIDLEEEIRLRAYERHLQRHGQSENAAEDWHMAVCDVCPRYEADGYRTGIRNGRWQAVKN